MGGEGSLLTVTDNGDESYSVESISEKASLTDNGDGTVALEVS